MLVNTDYDFIIRVKHLQFYCLGYKTISHQLCDKTVSVLKMASHLGKGVILILTLNNAIRNITGTRNVPVMFKSIKHCFFH